MRLRWILLSGVIALAGCGLSAAVNLVPQPKEFTQQDVVAALPDKVFVVKPAVLQSLCHDTAVELLRKDFKNQFGINVITATAAPSEMALVITLRNGTADLQSEGYRMAGKKNGSNYEISIASGDNGVLYGVLTLIDLLKEAGSVKDKLLLPREFNITDWPSCEIRGRIQVTQWRDNKQPAREYLDRQFEDMTRTRLNVTWSDPGYAWYKDWVEAANKYGIRIYAITSYGELCNELKRALCPCKTEDVKKFDDLIISTAKSGLYGISFHFDDVEHYEFNGKRTMEALNHVKVCPECAARFKTSGNMHNFWVRRMVEIGRANGVKDFITCPAPYRRNDLHTSNTYKDPIWEGYFAQLTAGPGMEAVKTFNCAFDDEYLNELKKLGLRNYIFWVNGWWRPEILFAYYTGMPRIYELWYGFDFDPAAGPVPRTYIEDLKRLTKHTSNIYLGTGDPAGLYLGGIFAWNPEKFNEADALKTTSDKLYGPGVYEPLMAYHKAASRLVGFFQTYFNNETKDCKILPGNFLTLEQIKQELLKADAAYQAVLKINPKMQESGRMRTALDYFRGRIAAREKRDRLAGAEKSAFQKLIQGQEANQNVCAWWRFDDPANIGKDSSGNGIDLTITGKPELIEANFGKAVKLHGGQFGNVKGVKVLQKGIREYLEQPKDKKLKIGGNDSFTVDMWINYQGDRGPAMTDWNEFIGTRSTGTFSYPKNKGWGIGSSKTLDDVIFIVDDGNKMSFITISARKNPGFDLTGWVHIVAVRDCRKKELRMYINGQAIPPVKDETGDISVNNGIVIGQDDWTGTWTEAFIDEIRILDQPYEFKKEQARSIPDPSFEDGIGGVWQVGSGNPVVDAAVKHEGAVSIRFDKPDSNPAAESTIYIQDCVAVDGNKNYVISAWAKGENIVPGKEGWHKFIIVGRWFDKDMKQITAADLPLGTGTYDWTRFETVRTSPPNAAYYRTTGIGIMRAGTGRGWVDSIDIRPQE